MLFLIWVHSSIKSPDAQLTVPRRGGKGRGRMRGDEGVSVPITFVCRYSTLLFYVVLFFIRVRFSIKSADAQLAVWRGRGHGRGAEGTASR